MVLTNVLLLEEADGLTQRRGDAENAKDVNLLCFLVVPFRNTIKEW